MTDFLSAPVRRPLAIMLAAALSVSAAPAFGQSSSSDAFSLELNRLDAAGDDCRVTLVEKNGTKSAFAALKLDLVVFDGAGIVTKRVGVDAGPLKAGRTVVKTFDLKGLACDGVGRLLINDVLACEAEGIAVDACLDLLEPRSRVAAPFDK
mgnify:CR=1 FL=1